MGRIYYRGFSRGRDPAQNRQDSVLDGKRRSEPDRNETVGNVQLRTSAGYPRYVKEKGIENGKRLNTNHRILDYG